MTLAPVGVRDAKVTLVANETYLRAVRALLTRATRRALVSMFIVELSPERDPFLRVDEQLHHLADARIRGADARLLLGGSRTNREIAELALAARGRARELGVPARTLMGARTRGSHAKVVISDDAVLVGSHNWSPGAFGHQMQDSLLVESEALATHLHEFFDQQWARAGLGGG